MNRPSISVIVPVFNGREFLADALRSILDQSLAADEIIVVNDGSTDNSSEVAMRFGPLVRVVSQPHAGVGAARNAGVGSSTGSYLAFLDADDLMPPQRLERQAGALSMVPECELVFGRQCRFAHGEPLQRLPQFQHEAARCDRAILAGAMMCRRGSFDKLGWFATDGVVGEFIRWFDRALAARVQWQMPSEVVVYRRRHGGNLSLHRPEYARMVHQLLVQRRSASIEREVV